MNVPSPVARRGPLVPTILVLASLVAAFLAGDDSRYLTGNTLFVDGGSHINGSPWVPDLPED